MSEVLREDVADGIVLLRINRPEAKNALNLAVRQQLAALFSALAEDDAVRAVVLTGDAQAFAAGADIRDMADAGAIDMLLRRTEQYWRPIAGFPKPLIAAVNGYAWGGGCELALHADVIIAGETASFCQPEVKVGIMPGAGGTQRLARAIGKTKAMLMILTGQPMTGIEAAAAGLASEVRPDGEVLPRALEIAGIIARMPPIAVRQIKEVMLAGLDSPLEVGITLERKAFQLLFDTRDQKEGMLAFLDKRRPGFEGR